MKVSIIIPCFNTEAYISEAVRSAFAQTYLNIEVIAVDDGSSDSSLAVLNSLKQNEYPELVVLQHEDRQNYGVSSARRLGVEYASGEYIAFLDADDVLLTTNIERQVLKLKANPGTILCHTGMKVIGDTSDAEYLESVFAHRPTSPYYFHKQADYLARNGISCSSVLVERKALLSIPFDTAQLYQFEDWLCWCLLAKKGKFIFLDEQLALYRVHPESATTLVRKSELVAHYSKLEMKLALAIKTDSWMTAAHTLVSIARSALALMLIYAEKSAFSSPERSDGVFYQFVQYFRRLKHGKDIRIMKQ